MAHQSRSWFNRCRVRSLHRPVYTIRKPPVSTPYRVNDPVNVDKRRHQKISTVAHELWKKRNAVNKPGDAHEDWCEAAKVVDNKEAVAWCTWQQTIYRAPLTAMMAVTGLPEKDIEEHTFLPRSIATRQRLYGMIEAILTNRSIQDCCGTTGGYAETFGELVEEVATHCVWVKYAI